MTTEVRTTDIGKSSIALGDVVPMGSRVSWGSILAGAVIALAVYLVLTLLGGALGLTISDRVRTETLGTGAAIWSVFSTIVALFVGGWVTSQCSVGETNAEAVIHGVIMWGVVLFMILWLVGTGMRTGFNAMWGVASFTDSVSQNTTVEDWEAAARRNNVPQESIDEWKRKAKEAPSKVIEAARNPENQKAALDYATHATWYTLLGTLLSMAAAIGGAIVGSGPSFRLIARPVVRRVIN